MHENLVFGFLSGKLSFNANILMHYCITSLFFFVTKPTKYCLKKNEMIKKKLKSLTWIKINKTFSQKKI